MTATQPVPSSAKEAPAISWSEVALADINAEDISCRFRFSPTHADLQASLDHEGQLTPIDLAGEKPYRVVDGFRRLAAAHALGWTTIKAYTHGSMTEGEAMRLALNRNVVRKCLSPLERATAFHLTLNTGMKMQTLSSTVGLSEKQIRRYLGMLSFPESIQKEVDSRAISMAHAKVLVDQDVSNLDEWCQRIKEEGLDARTLKRFLARETRKTLPARTWYARVERDRQQVRFHSCVLRLKMAKSEREKAVRQLRQALEFLDNGEDQSRESTADS